MKASGETEPMARPSLIETDDKQGELFSPEKLENNLNTHARSGKSTGARIFEKNPALYNATIKLAALDYSNRAIADLLTIDAGTVQSILNREPGSIQAFRRRVSLKWRSVAEQAVELLEYKLDDLPASELTRAAATALDKALAMMDEGGPEDSGPEHETLEDIDEALSKLPSKPAGRGPVIDIEPAFSGFDGGKRAEKGTPGGSE